jgi:hypothetical protein
LVVFIAFRVFTRASPDERATDLARRMVVTHDPSEIEATIIPQFEQETDCQFVLYFPFYGPTLDDVARRVTKWGQDFATFATPKPLRLALALALGKQLARRPSRNWFTRRSIATRPLSRLWTAKHHTWTPGFDWLDSTSRLITTIPMMTG